MKGRLLAENGNAQRPYTMAHDHIGEVVYGNVGAPDRLDFTVMGPVVNRTARLESLTKELGCNILFSQQFSELIEIPSEFLGQHEMKGIAEPQAVYALCQV